MLLQIPYLITLFLLRFNFFRISLEKLKFSVPLPKAPYKKHEDKFSVTLPKVPYIHKKDEDKFSAILPKVPYIHKIEEDKLPVTLPRAPYMGKKDEDEHPIPTYLYKLLNNNRPHVSTPKEQEIRENLR